MVKNSIPKLGQVPKMRHKITPDISHLTGVKNQTELKLKAHGGLSLDELFPDHEKSEITDFMEHITEFEVRHKDGSFDIVTVYDLPEDLAIKWIEIKYPDSQQVIFERKDTATYD